MKKLIPILSAAMLAGCMCDKAAKCPATACGNDPVMGNWSADLPYDTMPAGSFIFSRDASGAPQAFVLYRWGSPVWVRDLKVCGNFFSFTHPYGYRYEGSVLGDKMIARLARCDGKTGALKDAWQPFYGWRNPAICDKVRTEDAKLGKPINLLKDGLDGWVTMNPKAKFGWSFKDGVLSNKPMTRSGSPPPGASSIRASPCRGPSRALRSANTAARRLRRTSTF